MLNFVKRHSFHDRSLAEPEGVELRDWLRPRRGRTADWHRVARKLDYAPRLQEVEASTLILCGRYDPPFPPSCSEELAAGIRTARTVYFERSGHYPFIEEPEAFWAVVGAFLAPSRTPPA